jgi:hypothetical protein
MSEERILPGMILIEDKGTSATLWAVSGVRDTKKGASVTLRSYSGSTNGNCWASSEARATFPDGVVRAPFHLVTVRDVVAGKWPERLKPEVADAA